MSDSGFEEKLFRLYGEPSTAARDVEVTERLLRGLDRERSGRNRFLAIAVCAGSLLGAAAAALLAGSFMQQAAVQTGAPAPILWAALLAVALGLGAAAARLAGDA